MLTDLILLEQHCLVPDIRSAVLNRAVPYISMDRRHAPSL